MQRISDAELERVREGFYLRGESIADWSRQRGFSPNTVYQVLSGRCLALRGGAHVIATALGLKPRAGGTDVAYMGSSTDEA